MTSSFPANAITILNERYAQIKEDGTKETVEEIFHRVADAIAAAEAIWAPGGDVLEQGIADTFYDGMINRRWMPNSPCIANAGMAYEYGKAMAACYVLPMEDSRESIMKAITKAVEIHATGGGTGVDLSPLREEGSKTRGGTASGPISFAKIWNEATEQIKQAGQRRGANMGVLRCDHPDLLKFIDCKKERRLITKVDGSTETLRALNNFNISVTCTDAFMHAVENDLPWDLWSRSPYSYGEVVATYPAKELWAKIMESAWQNGDPGILFIDRANQSRSNPIPEVEQICVTNPCGEIFLGPNDVCNLISINLERFYVHVVPKKGGKLLTTDHVNWEQLKKDVWTCVRFMDNLIEINPIPIEEIRQKNLQLRRIAVGVMGWADLLHRIGIAYDSDSAIVLAESVMSFISKEADKASAALAEGRGSFPLHSQSIYKDKPMRNAQRTAIMPTGTISFIADCSSGIEPRFGLTMTHDNKLGRVVTVVDYVFEEKLNGKASESLEQWVQDNGSLQGFSGPVPESVRHFRTAFEVAPEWHIRHQAAFQKFLDNACSKSINLPNNATVKDVENCYWQAWKSGCKGITVYRNDCDKEVGQVLNIGNKNAVVAEIKKVLPSRLAGFRHQLKSPLGTMYIIVNTDEDGKPMELFCVVGKAGSDTHAEAENLGRMVSLYLRFPYQPGETVHERVHEIVHQLSNVGGRSQAGIGPNRVRSIGDGIALVLEREFVSQDIQRDAAPLRSDEVQVKRAKGDLCPSCGSATFIREEGCEKCMSCGHSSC